MTLLFAITMMVVMLIVTIVGIPLIPAAIIGGTVGLIIALYEKKGD